MNRRIIVPLAALIAELLRSLLGIEIAEEHIEITISTILLIVAGVGIFMDPKRKRAE